MKAIQGGFKHYALLALSVMLMAGMIYSIKLEVFMQHLGQIHPLSGCLILGIYALTWWFRAQRLRGLLPEQISLGNAFRVQIAGFALNFIYPAKLGDLFMGVFLKEKAALSYQKSLAYVLHLHLLDFLVLVVMVIMSVVFLPWENLSPELLQALGGLMLVVLLIGGGLLVLKKSPLLNRLKKLLPKKYNPTALLKQLAEFHHLKSGYWISYFHTLVIWVLEVATCYIFATQIAPEISFWAILAALSFGNIMKVIPFLPGGMGTYDAGFVFILIIHGVPYEVAASLSLLDHLVKKLLNLAVGFPIYLGLQKKGEGSSFAGITLTQSEPGVKS
ncbi:MAG: lysylphosphatidylglycerol synthase transmembrane domain-containing protein [Bacteroidia bacterium]|nr:lysylphosphatidylglycerol synthase transmembrane domain-containing protein [Bacteroidia bacterium]